jgi:hypothetical protein
MPACRRIVASHQRGVEMRKSRLSHDDDEEGETNEKSVYEGSQFALGFTFQVRVNPEM